MTHPLHSPTLRRLCRLLCTAALAAAPLTLTRAAETADSLAPGWWKDASFYQIFIRSFADASTGPLAQDGIGDLQGLIERLDALNDGKPSTQTDLGIDALWLMPLHPSPSYHGYDVSDYFGVNPQYGDTTLMKRLVAEAHKRGIRVIIDLVLNHASSEHPLFKKALAGDAEARRSFLFSDRPRQLSGPWDQRLWHPVRGAANDFYYGIFTAAMPDWNLAEPSVKAHHFRVADYWLKEIGVDGFRLDAVRYLVEDGQDVQDIDPTRNWLREFKEYCHAVKPGSFLVGECYADTRTIASYAKAGALDSFFEFGQARATIEALRLGNGALLSEQLERARAANAGREDWSSFLSNHDQERLATQLGGNAAQIRLASELLFLLPGTPFVYYGEEIGMRGAKPDPDLRTPMQWTGEPPHAGFTDAQVAPWRDVNADYPRVNVAIQSNDPASLIFGYRKLLRLNRETPALRHGRSLPVETRDPRLFVELREHAGHWVLVLANLSDAVVASPALRLPETLPEGLAFEEALHASAVTQAGETRDWTPLRELAPRSAYLLRSLKR